MPTISLCMIVKDEEQFLEKCLQSVQGLVDEIVIVDTGSIDRTKEIANTFTKKVFDFQWCDNFSAARNESLKHAIGDWILVLDADEILPDESKAKIKKAVNEAETNNVYGYFLPQVTLTNIHLNHPTFVKQEFDFTGTFGLGLAGVGLEKFAGYISGDIIRLFRRNPFIFYEFHVHEKVNPSLKRNNLKVEQLLAPIMHFEELKGAGNIDVKQEYYFKLSLKDIDQYPGSAQGYHDAGLYYRSYKKENALAEKYFRKALELEPENPVYILDLSFLLRDLGRYNEVVELLEMFLADRVDERMLIALGFAYYKLGEDAKSLKSYSRVLEINSPRKEQIMGIINFLKKKINQ